MILAIETATPHGSVALVSGELVRAEAALSRGRQASATILSAVDGLLRETGSGPAGIGHVAVSAGPGSFTGLRVGMAAAKGFCFGWRIPIVPVPTLHALARRFRSAGMTVCPVLNARKQEVYAALFRWEGGECLRVSPDMAIAPAELPGKLPAGPVFFCGDGAAPFAPLFRERMGDRAVFAAEAEGLPSAAAVGLLAARLVLSGAAADPRQAVPAYVRPFI
jgi:tRNA threonylcarbamoyladenosine biosynthesis protein TsaB